MTGTQDDDDDRDDEHPRENEAGVRETDEHTEAPEEFEIENIDPAIAALAETRKIYSAGYFLVLFFLN